MEEHFMGIKHYDPSVYASDVTDIELEKVTVSTMSPSSNTLTNDENSDRMHTQIDRDTIISKVRFTIDRADLTGSDPDTDPDNNVTAEVYTPNYYLENRPSFKLNPSSNISPDLESLSRTTICRSDVAPVVSHVSNSNVGNFNQQNLSLVEEDYNILSISPQKSRLQSSEIMIQKIKSLPNLNEELCKVCAADWKGSTPSAYDMRCLALIAHNNMKPAMRDFVMRHFDTIRRFRVTGTETTMGMVRSVRDECCPENDVEFFEGPECTSGPLGGDIQISMQLVCEKIGAIIFFQDPLTPHPHQADIESLSRLALVHNVIVAVNPASAEIVMDSIESSFQMKNYNKMTPFFTTAPSPCILKYKEELKKRVTKVCTGKQI